MEVIRKEKSVNSIGWITENKSLKKCALAYLGSVDCNNCSRQ